MQTYRLDMFWTDLARSDFIADFLQATTNTILSLKRPEEEISIHPLSESKQRLYWLAPWPLPGATVKVAEQAIDRLAQELMLDTRDHFRRSDLEQEFQLLIGFGDDSFIGRWS